VTQSADQNKRFLVRDVFEIKEEYPTGHALGVVVVLDQQVVSDPAMLVGKHAVICAPDGRILSLEVDDAQDHLAATSLFFRNNRVDDTPLGSQVMIALVEQA